MYVCGGQEGWSKTLKRKNKFNVFDRQLICKEQNSNPQWEDQTKKLKNKMN